MSSYRDKGKAPRPPSPPPESSAASMPTSEDPHPPAATAGPSPTPELPPGVYSPEPLTTVYPQTTSDLHARIWEETPEVPPGFVYAPKPLTIVQPQSPRSIERDLAATVVAMEALTGGTQKPGRGRPKGSTKYPTTTATPEELAEQVRRKDNVLLYTHGPLPEPPKYVLALPREKAKGDWDAHRAEKKKRRSKTPKRPKAKAKSKSSSSKQDPHSATQPSQDASFSSAYDGPIDWIYHSPHHLPHTGASPISMFPPSGTSPSHVAAQTSVPSSTPPSAPATTPQPSTTTGKRPRGRPPKNKQQSEEQSGISSAAGIEHRIVFVNPGEDIFETVVSFGREMHSPVRVYNALGYISEAIILPQNSSEPREYPPPEVEEKDRTNYYIYAFFGEHHREYSEGQEGLTVIFGNREGVFTGEAIGPIIAATRVQIFMEARGSSVNVEEQKKKRKRRKDPDIGDHEGQKQKKYKGPDMDPNSGGGAGSAVPCS